jgi:phage baseplate assembly protein W
MTTDPSNRPTTALNRTEDFPHVGTGWAFPVRWGIEAAGVGTATGADKIVQSISLLLRTAVGSRVMRPDFGAGVDRYVFDTRSDTTCFRLAYEVRQALLRWEPRVLTDSVEAVPAGDEDNRIDVTIQFRIDPHRRPTSLVLPFYLEERS